jgi:hypothetical protein
MEFLRHRWYSPAFHIKVFNKIYTYFEGPLPQQFSLVILSVVSLPRQKTVQSHAGIASKYHAIQNHKKSRVSYSAITVISNLKKYFNSSTISSEQHFQLTLMSMYVLFRRTSWYTEQRGHIFLQYGN